MKRPRLNRKNENPPARPAPQDCRRAAETLIAEHLAIALESGADAIVGGALERKIQGGPDVAVFTVSGCLIKEFEEFIDSFKGDLDFTREDVAITPPSDAELAELRKIAGLPKQ